MLHIKTGKTDKVEDTKPLKQCGMCLLQCIVGICRF